MWVEWGSPCLWPFWWLVNCSTCSREMRAIACVRGELRAQFRVVMCTKWAFLIYMSHTTKDGFIGGPVALRTVDSRLFIHIKHDARPTHLLHARACVCLVLYFYRCDFALSQSRLCALASCVTCQFTLNCTLRKKKQPIHVDIEGMYEQKIDPRY